MGRNRNVNFFTGLRYQGGGPMITWMLHRITGVGILFFVGLHVTASFFMQQSSSDWAIAVNTLYESWIFQIIIVFFVVFHVLNGLRVAILDIWPQFLEYQREAIWLEWFVIAPVYGLTVFVIITRGLSGG